MSAAPAVSVVLPTRDRPGLLDRAIRSVLSQDAALELLVVDDGSERSAADVIRERLGVDERIRFERLDGVGAAAARNHAIQCARADVIAFIDDDDEWLPGRLRRQLAALEADPGIGVVHAPFYEVDDGEALLYGRLEGEPDDIRGLLLRGNVIGHSTVAVRRSALREVGGFDERLPRLQDWDLWIRLAAVTRFHYQPEPAARIHRTPGSISTRTDALRRACAILDGKYAAAGWTPDDLATLRLSLARLLIGAGDGIQGRRFVARSLGTRPWPPRRLLLAATLLLGRRAHDMATTLHGALQGSAGAEGKS